jgi:hypothetical protein
MATIEEKTAHSLWPDGGPMDYLDGLPVDAVPHDKLADTDYVPDDQDKIAYGCAFGIAWALGKLENPFAQPEALAATARAAAIKACQA